MEGREIREAEWAEAERLVRELLAAPESAEREAALRARLRGIRDRAEKDLRAAPDAARDALEASRALAMAALKALVAREAAREGRSAKAAGLRRECAKVLRRAGGAPGAEAVRALAKALR